MMVNNMQYSLHKHGYFNRLSKIEVTFRDYK